MPDVDTRTPFARLVLTESAVCTDCGNHHWVRPRSRAKFCAACAQKRVERSARRRRGRLAWLNDPLPSTVKETGVIPVATDDGKAFVYIALDRRGRVLYVGLTGSLPERLGTHRFQAAWWKDVAEIRWEALPSRHLAAMREGQLIDLLEPLHNKLRGLVYCW